MAKQLYILLGAESKSAVPRVLYIGHGKGDAAAAAQTAPADLREFTLCAAQFIRRVKREERSGVSVAPAKTPAAIPQPAPSVAAPDAQATAGDLPPPAPAQSGDDGGEDPADVLGKAAAAPVERGPRRKGS